MDKDFRSLEHKIRDLMMETMARNSAKRMQIANVGRPTDTDDKSKLAKNAEIKAKVIDEEAIDEAEKDPDKHFAAQSKKMQDAINLHLRRGKSYWEAHRAAKVHVKEEVSDAAKKVLGDVAKKHGGQVPFKSTSYKDGKRVVTHGYNDEKGNRVVTKTTNEEIEEIDEISKDLATRYKDKVLNMPAAEQDKEKPRQKINRMIGAARAIGKIQKDPNRKVHATEEVIDEAQTKQQRTAKAALATQSGEYDAGKKGGAINRMALMKPKDLKKLAKEEVDPPVTTDKKKDKEKSDMDDMDANKIKGGKTEVNLQPRTDDRPEEASLEDSKSKKATKDENQKIGAKSGVKEQTMSNTPFGLPQGLIDAVNEALKGGQKKLDKNHNGKLDGQDFKILRGEKVKEEAVVEDEQIDEVSKDTLQHYIRRASSDAANHAYTAGKGAHGKMTINKDAYHAMADKRLRGISKAAQKLAKEEVEDLDEKDNMASKNPKDQSKLVRPSGNPFKPIKKMTKEEVEQIDELSKATLGSYAKRSATQLGHKASQSGYAIGIGQGDSEHAKETNRKKTNRFKGLSKAIDKMAKEEVEFSDEEIARIEAIAKGLE